MEQRSEIIINAEELVYGLFKAANTEKLFYHNFKHTFDVAEACEEIGLGMNISASDMEIVLLAAWFHDVGYLTSFEEHELLGVEQAVAFLTEKNYDTDKIALIKGCIMATKMGTDPTNLLEEIICDADMKGLSSQFYNERSQLLKEECLHYKNDCGNESEWLEMEINFLTKHKYYTKFAALNYNDKKLGNILLRKVDLKKQSSKSVDKKSKSKLKEKELQLKIEKSEIPEKGIETMFRTSLKNHMELSAIADNKANIMLSINALILSIIISALFSKFDKHPELIIPSISMLVVCLSTIVLATLSTKPKVTAGKFSAENVTKRKANLLFFGNFHKMELQDYEWGMKEIMKDKEYLYSSLIRDLHSLGVVLAKKYNYLRICYLVFMYGMIISVLLFAAFMFTSA